MANIRALLLIFVVLVIGGSIMININIEILMWIILIVFIILTLFRLLTLLMNFREEINGRANLLLPAIAALQPKQQFLATDCSLPLKTTKETRAAITALHLYYL